MMQRGMLLALSLYLGLCWMTVRNVGIVGEVAISAQLSQPPTTWVALDPPQSAVDTWGPLTARLTRPTESLDAGGLSLPWMVNAYTGGLPDWPARFLMWVGGPAWAQWTGVGLGALLLVLAHRFLRFHGSDGAATAAAMILASDWSFVFYKKVLGGTEVLLQAASLLLVWALWSRRWKGGQHGTVAIAVGIGLGLMAKLTFIAVLAAIGVAVFLTRWDRGPFRPPEAIHPLKLAVIPVMCLAPFLIAAVHHALAPLPVLASHDSFALQWARLLSGWTQGTPDREGFWNIVRFLQNPLGFFADAYGATAQAPLSLGRSLGWLVTLAGIGLAWKERQASASDALLRFLSLSFPLALIFITILNRDLHHLAQTTVLLALLGGLAADRMAATLAPRGWLRRGYALILVMPQVIAGGLQLQQTDALVAEIKVPTFTAEGQAEIVSLLREHHVKQLIVADYESYGMLEVLAPDVEIVHVWPAVTAGATPSQLLQAARGRYFLSVRASMPMIYNWNPSAATLRPAAEAAGVQLTRVGGLGEGKQERAALYKVD